MAILLLISCIENQSSYIVEVPILEKNNQTEKPGVLSQFKGHETEATSKPVEKGEESPKETEKPVEKVEGSMVLIGVCRKTRLEKWHNQKFTFTQDTYNNEITFG